MDEASWTTEEMGMDLLMYDGSKPGEWDQAVAIEHVSQMCNTVRSSRGQPSVYSIYKTGLRQSANQK